MECLRAGSSLVQNQSIVSPNRRYVLTQQNDGNLVIYDKQNNSTPTWHSNTATGGQNRVVMQNDGNFVVYDNNGPIWSASSNRDNFQGCLMLTDEGRLMIYDQVFDVTNAPARP